MKAHLQDLELRIQEMEKSSGRSSVRMEDMQDQINLMSDRVETVRLAQTMRGEVKQLPVVVAVPGGNQYTGTSNTPRYQPPTSAMRAPARPLPGTVPTQQTAPLPPVARISLAGTEPKVPAAHEFHQNSPLIEAPKPGTKEAEAISHIQITEEQYNKLEAESPSYDDPQPSTNSVPRGTRRSVGSYPTRSSRPAGTAKAPVTDERLPAVAIDNIAAGPSKTVPVQPPKESAPPEVISDNPMDVYKKALSSYRKGEYAHAFNQFKAYLDLGPSRDYLDNAYYWLGECSFGMGKYDQAISYFGRVIKETPGGNKVPDSMLKASLAYQRLGNTSQAKSTLYNLIETYPTTNAAKLATEKLKALE